MPRPKIPNQVQILNVAPGTTAGSSGGVYLTADSLITARLTGDDSAFFTIGQLETFDVDFDPDARPPQEVLVPALKVSGAGPIEAFQGEAILVTVEFACPADPLKATFHARAILEGAGLPAPISVLVTATARVGMLQAFNIGNPLISPRDTENFTFLVSSTLGHPVPIAFRYDTEFEPLFSAITQFPPSVPANGSVEFGVDITCAADAPIGNRSVIFQMLSADETQVLGSIEFGINVILPLPPPHVPVDPSIVWEESTDLSISIDPSPSVNAWNAGRIKDILLRSDAIFVAASTGGVWGINVHEFDAGAGCTTDDLDNPNFTCLAFGPDSPLQIYGACSSLLPGARPGTGLFLRGLSEWRPVPIVDRFNSPLLTNDILRIAVLPNHQVILLATMQGVFMSFIPPPGQTHTFSLAPGLPVQPFSGLCVGPNETVVVSRLGPNGGIFLGSWSGSQLIFAPAQIIPDPSQNNGDIDLTQVGNTSLASCGSDPSIMYAVFAGSSTGFCAVTLAEHPGVLFAPWVIGSRALSWHPSLPTSSIQPLTITWLGSQAITPTASPLAFMAPIWSASAGPTARGSPPMPPTHSQVGYSPTKRAPALTCMATYSSFSSTPTTPPAIPSMLAPTEA